MIFNPSEPQTLATTHLLRNPEAALFMGCGLGKTASVLNALDHLTCEGATDGTLIVAPLRVCNLTWPAEIEKWAQFRHLRIANLRTEEGMETLRRGDANIYVTNYEQLPQLQEKYLFGRRKLNFDTVVWDELTRTKNHKSKRVRAVYPYIRAKMKRHWGLTGTPTPNGLLDLFGQIRLLDGGMRLGRSYSLFRDTYFYPTDYMRYNWAPQPDARERIYKRLEGFALTLTSEDWLDIPDVNQEDIELTLPEEAQGQYNELERELLLMLKDGSAVVAVNAAVLVNKLLQVTSGAVYLEDKSWRPLHDAKDKALAALLKKLRGQPVMIACQYRHEQERIRKQYPGAVFFQDAKTDGQQRDVAARWNAGKIPWLVANPASIGHGLNLQEGGSTVIWYTLPWSRELYDQFNARVARRGQNRVTTIYRLMMRDTADVAVAEALRRKDEEQAALLSALKAWSKAQW